jgi:acetoin utilization protein AcuB
MGTDPTNAICTIKVQGASISKVVELIKPYVSQLLDVREV